MKLMNKCFAIKFNLFKNIENIKLAILIENGLIFNTEITTESKNAHEIIKIYFLILSTIHSLKFMKSDQIILNISNIIHVIKRT